MILLDVSDRLRAEMVETLLHGASDRLARGHPPTTELAQLIRALRHQESASVVTAPQTRAETNEVPQDGASGIAMLLSRRIAAEVLGVSTSHLDRLRRNGSLPEVRVGRRVMIRRTDLDTFVEKRTVWESLQ